MRRGRRGLLYLVDLGISLCVCVCVFCVHGGLVVDRGGGGGGFGRGARLIEWLLKGYYRMRGN